MRYLIANLDTFLNNELFIWISKKKEEVSSRIGTICQILIYAINKISKKW